MKWKAKPLELRRFPVQCLEECWYVHLPAEIHWELSSMSSLSWADRHIQRTQRNRIIIVSVCRAVCRIFVLSFRVFSLTLLTGVTLFCLSSVPDAHGPHVATNVRWPRCHRQHARLQSAVWWCARESTFFDIYYTYYKTDKIKERKKNPNKMRTIPR